MRYDVLERAFDSKKNVFYVEHFPISQIYSGEQGWEADQVRELMNRLLVAYHLTPVNHLSEFNSVVSKKLFEDAHDFTPPIIATVLPDNHVDLLDGNHRVALFQIFLRLPTIRAFIIV